MRDNSLTVGDGTRLGLPVRWLVGVAAALLVLGGGGAVGQAKLSAGEAKDAAQDARIAEVEKATVTHSIRDAALEADVRHISKAVERVENKVDLLLEKRGVRRAGGER